MQESLGLESELVPGDAGVFDVVHRGELLFSKHETGRFPEDHEILEALRGR